ncbi:MAG: prepilin-type N-terminal cleavage/methylation domain-containing protein [Lachnospiraceae bacterium]
MNIQDFETEKLNNNGFSLVELLVAVAILSVIVVPIMKSFTTSAITSAKAQSMQNATSLAEKQMEIVKTKTIKQLIEDDGFIKDESNNSYKGKYKGVTATNGEKFDVYVDITSDKYSKESAADVSDINSIELPKLYDIQNSKPHAVISWEINEYDMSAVQTLAYKMAVTEESISETGKKATIIDMKDDGTIDCFVEYYINQNNSTPDMKYKVYSNSLGNAYEIVNESKDDGGPHLYIVYTMSEHMNSAENQYFKNEEIHITDNTKRPDVSKKYRQNIYIIMQHDLKDMRDGNSNLKVYIEGKAICIKKDGYPDKTKLLILPDDMGDEPFANKWQLNTDEDSYLYTNFLPASEDVDASLFYGEKKDRIYQVRVRLVKTGDPEPKDDDKVKAELISTMKVR